MKPLRKSALSPAWRAFVNHCQRLNFATLEDVEFRDGEPVGTMTAVKTIAFGCLKNNGAAREFGDSDSVLSERWRDAITLVASRAHLRVRRFEIAHGDPLKLHVEEHVAVSK